MGTQRGFAKRFGQWPSSEQHSLGTVEKYVRSKRRAERICEMNSRGMQLNRIVPENEISAGATYPSRESPCVSQFFTSLSCSFSGLLLVRCVAARCQVYDIYPDLLAEQTAYATAAATLNLKHYRLNNLAMRSEGVRTNRGITLQSPALTAFATGRCATSLGVIIPDANRN